MPSRYVRSNLKHSITVSNIKYLAKCFDKESFVSIDMLIQNETYYKAEFNYEIPFSSSHTPISLSASFQNQKKTALIKPFKLSTNVRFDDDVAEENLTIKLFQKDEFSTYLVLSNLYPGSILNISVEILVPLFENFQNFMFCIPSIEKIEKHFYPSYSFFLQNLTQNFKTIQIEYNGEIFEKEIKPSAEIKALEVSPNLPLIIKIPRNNTERDYRCYSLKNQQNLVLFINSCLSQNKKIISLIINLLKNYGDNFKFNIYQYGKNSKYLFNEMLDKSKETINLAEKFLNSQNSTEDDYSFIDIFSAVFNLGKNNNMHKINEFNTIAVCFGSFKSDDIFGIKKITTYLVDPIQNFNTAAFAKRNHFHYIGPMLHNEKDLVESFENLLKTIKMNSIHISNKSEKILQKVIELDELNEKMSLNDFKKHMIDFQSSPNMLIKDFKFVIEKVLHLIHFTTENYEEFYEEINLKGNRDKMYQLIWENDEVEQLIKQLIIFNFLNGELFDSILKSRTFSVDFFESITKCQFISFESNNDNWKLENRYITSSSILKENSEPPKYNFESKSQEKSKCSKEKPFFFEEQFEIDLSKENKKKKEKTKKKRNNDIKHNNNCNNIVKKNLSDYTESLEKIEKKLSDQNEMNEFFESKPFQPQIDLNPIGLDLSYRFSA